MYDHVYIIYAFVKFLDEPPVIIRLNCHPGLGHTGNGRITPDKVMGILISLVLCPKHVWSRPDKD